MNFFNAKKMYSFRRNDVEYLKFFLINLKVPENNTTTWRSF